MLELYRERQEGLTVQHYHEQLVKLHGYKAGLSADQGPSAARQACGTGGEGLGASPGASLLIDARQLLETLQSRIAAGDAVDDEQMIRLTNAQARALRSLAAIDHHFGPNKSEVAGKKSAQPQ